MNERMPQELTLQLVEHAKRGDRWFISGIEQDDFHERAEAVKKEAEKRGISVGAVYHVPLKMGTMFVL